MKTTHAIRITFGYSEVHLFDSEADATYWLSEQIPEDNEVASGPSQITADQAESEIRSGLSPSQTTFDHRKS